MGQYYRIALKSDSDKVRVNCRENPLYSIGKLMEHSYFGNYTMDAVAKVLENSPTCLIWVGDYADNDDEVSKHTGGEVTYEDVWNCDKVDVLEHCDFDYSGKFLVNYDTNQYISFDKYMKEDGSNDGINPISILTCIGNGRGGGDYYGTCMDMVGKWAWNRIGIVGVEPIIGFNEI